MEYIAHLPPTTMPEQRVYIDNVEYYPYTNHPVKDIVAHYMARESRWFTDGKSKVDTDE